MASNIPADYVGRFAPSPTGPLHFGSLLAATASYLEARLHNGKWLLRIEDIDPPRAQPDADTAILMALDAYGFVWDGSVYYQSREYQRHLGIVQQLLTKGLAYRCACSRQDLAALPQGPLGSIYPGTCRNGCDAAEAAIRVITDDRTVAFHDALQGQQEQRVESESGDFVIRRRDGLIAYHLAVVADDFDQGITHVVRGMDLLDSSPRQIYLQRILGYPTPGYAHIPIGTDVAGRKLSKATGAPALATKDARPSLVAALNALGQAAPSELMACNLESIWSWALTNWNMLALARQTSLAITV